MDIARLVKDLENKQINLSIKDHNLKIQAPKGAVSSELQKELLTYKSQILSYLQNQLKTPNNQMDFSIFFFSSDESVNQNDKYRLVIEAAKFADNNGFTGVWTPERHFHQLGGLFPNPAIIASALSTITKNIKLRAGSVVLPLHDPVSIVEDWSVIDNLSAGRVEISFASGWHVNDFIFSPDNYGQRKDILFNHVQIVKDLWAGKSIKRKSGAGNLIEISTKPSPIQNNLPVWITAIGNPDTYIKAGEIGANLMTCLLDQDINELSEKIKLYRKSLTDNGFNPQSKKVAVFLHTYLGKDLKEVKEKVYKPFTNYLKGTLNLIGKISESTDISINPDDLSEEDKEELLDFAFNRYFEERTLMGTVQSSIEIVQKLKNADIDELACLIDFGLDFSDIMESLNEVKVLKESFNIKY